jgi:hypothetical protein
MEIKVECSCGQHMLIGEKAFGQAVACPACGKPVNVSTCEKPKGMHLHIIATIVLSAIAFWIGISVPSQSTNRPPSAQKAATVQPARIAENKPIEPAKPEPKIELIDGAFGMKLGDEFDPSQAIGTSETSDGSPMYEFGVINGFRSFTRYYVLITPSTHKIYCIWGIGKVANTPTGQKEKSVVMELLKQKYGETDSERVMDVLRDAKTISKGNRAVMTKLTGFMDVVIEIRYYDFKLQEVAEKERLLTEVKKVDGSEL